MAKAPTDLRSLARAHTSTAIATLAGIMRQEHAPPAARVAAAQALLDRGWGKPDQHSTVDVIKRSAADWTNDELVAIIDAARTRGNGANAPQSGSNGPDSVH